MRALVEDAGLTHAITVDSAGTSTEELGHPVDPRAVLEAARRGLTLEHTAWQFQAEDFDRFDLVLVADEMNMKRMRRLVRSDPMRRSSTCCASSTPARIRRISTSAILGTADPRASRSSTTRSRRRVEACSMSSFVKTDRNAPAGFFAAEARGLEWLRAAGAVAVPRVLAVDETHIELERIEHGAWTAAADERFGRDLATLHQAGAACFGGDGPAFIGPLAMPNAPADSWPAFYVTQRVEPFLHAVGDRAPFERVIARIDAIAGPSEVPSRIHGDLWRGNVLADHSETPWVIDPAAHGGHRETDLAMMRLFGGFGARCYAAYDEVFPLADGWRERVSLHQLHPLLVHAVLFGGAYVAQATVAARCYA